MLEYPHPEIVNNGMDIVRTNYWSIVHPLECDLYLSWNEGAWRLLFPDPQIVECVAPVAPGSVDVLRKYEPGDEMTDVTLYFTDRLGGKFGALDVFDYRIDHPMSDGEYTLIGYIPRAPFDVADQGVVEVFRVPVRIDMQS